MRIERVQRNVTKFILNEYSFDVSYKDRCLNLGTLFYLNMTKTVQAQYMNFNRLARLWNKLPQHIHMSDSCTWGIICCCSGCDVR